MKVLQINCVYQKGSTGKITYDIAKGIYQNDIESVVCYGRGNYNQVDDKIKVYKCCSEIESNINHALSFVTGNMYGGCALSTLNLKKIISDEKPNIVHLQCINGYFVNIYKLLQFLARKNIPTVITLHAEFMYTGGCGYAYECRKWMEKPGCIDCTRYKKESGSLFFNRMGNMWKKMYRSMECFESKKVEVVSVSPWLQERAIKSPILSKLQHSVILNGLDTTVFRPCAQKEKKGTILHVSPEFTDDPQHVKGGYYIIELAKRMPEYTFIIAGAYKLKKAVPNNIKLLGKVGNQKKLAELYSEANVTVLASRRETFSMVCAESLSCGTPVVGFKAGAPEMIALDEYSEFVEYGNINELQKAVKQALQWNNSIEISKAAFKRYDRNQMIRDYIKIYRKLAKD